MFSAIATVAAVTILRKKRQCRRRRDSDSKRSHTHTPRTLTFGHTPRAANAIAADCEAVVPLASMVLPLLPPPPLRPPPVVISPRCVRARARASHSPDPASSRPCHTRGRRRGAPSSFLLPGHVAAAAGPRFRRVRSTSKPLVGPVEAFRRVQHWNGFLKFDSSGEWTRPRSVVSRHVSTQVFRVNRVRFHKYYMTTVDGPRQWPRFVGPRPPLHRRLRCFTSATVVAPYTLISPYPRHSVRRSNVPFVFFTLSEYEFVWGHRPLLLAA